MVLEDVDKFARTDFHYVFLFEVLNFLSWDSIASSDKFHIA